MKEKIYREFANKVYGDLGHEVYGEFDNLNYNCFGGQLSDKPILFAITPYGASKGLYQKESKAIVLQIRFLRNWSGLVTKELSHTLLHEMIHAYIDQKELKDNQSHGEHWADECNRIAPIIGIKNVHYTAYYRSKELGVGGKLVNVYKPIVAFKDDKDDMRTATRDELVRFPTQAVK